MWTSFTHQAVVAAQFNKSQWLRASPASGWAPWRQIARLIDFCTVKWDADLQGRDSQRHQRRGTANSLWAEWIFTPTSFCCSVWVSPQAVSARRHGAYHQSAAEGPECADCIWRSSPFLNAIKSRLVFQPRWAGWVVLPSIFCLHDGPSQPQILFSQVSNWVKS